MKHPTFQILSRAWHVITAIFIGCRCSSVRLNTHSAMMEDPCAATMLQILSQFSNLWLSLALPLTRDMLCTIRQTIPSLNSQYWHRQECLWGKPVAPELRRFGTSVYVITDSSQLESAIDQGHQLVGQTRIEKCTD